VILPDGSIRKAMMERVTIFDAAREKNRCWKFFMQRDSEDRSGAVMRMKHCRISALRKRVCRNSQVKN